MFANLKKVLYVSETHHMKIDLNQSDRLILKGTTSVIATVLCIILLVIMGISRMRRPHPIDLMCS